MAVVAAASAATEEGGSAAASAAAEPPPHQPDADFVDFRGLGGPWSSPHRVSPGELPRPSTSLQELELQVVGTDTIFGRELARLLLYDDGQVQQSELHLSSWLSELSQSASPLQAAHAYWAVSRGVRFLPRGHRRPRTRSPNYFKAEHRDVVAAEFRRLCSHGYVCEVSDFTPSDVLALGCVVKACGKVRCVVNASGPQGSSINDDIVDAGVAFPRLQDAGDILVRGDYMWKSDCSDYYLQFPLAPDQFPFVCVELGGRSLYYRRLCFGIRNAVRLAQGFSRLVTEMVLRRLRAVDALPRGIFEYLDDWLGVHSSHASASRGLMAWLTTCQALGLPYDRSKPGKVCPPATHLEYLGVGIDSVAMQYILSAARVTATIEAIDDFMGNPVVSLLQVQQLHGLLCFTTVGLPVGNHLLFGLRRLLSAGDPSQRRRRTLQVRDTVCRDLHLFQLALRLFNGRDVTAGIHRRRLPFDLVTDASVYGGAAFFGGHVATWRWSRIHDSADMAVLEARVLRLALERWGGHLHSSVLHAVGDNQGVSDILAGGTIRRSAALQDEFVRIICASLKFNITLVPGWLASDDNTLCDAGSRLHSPDAAVARRYAATLHEELHRWHTTHQPWVFRPGKVIRREADLLLHLWDDAHAVSAQGKRKCPSM